MDRSDPRLDLEITDGGFAVCPPRWVVGPRVMAEFEFVWILEGDVEWVCDGDVHRLGPGDVVLVRPGMRDVFRWDRVRNTRVGFFTFRLNSPGSLPPIESWPLVRSMSSDDVVRPLFRFVLGTYAEAPTDWEDRRHHEAATILWAFVNDTFNLGGLGSSRVHPLVDVVLGHLRDNWATPPLGRIAMPELAAVASVSTAHLSRVFTQTLGLSPMAIVRHMRAYWGAMALAWSDLPVGNVATEAGFPDMFHFSRRFRAVYGMPPTAFRRRYAEGTVSIDSIPPGAATAASRLWGGKEVAYR